MVAMNLVYFPIWECHHPNWRSYFSEGWPNHQPTPLKKTRFWVTPISKTCPKSVQKYCFKIKVLLLPQKTEGVLNLLSVTIFVSRFIFLHGMASGCHAFILLHNLANVRHSIVIHAEMFTSNGPFPTIVPSWLSSKRIKTDHAKRFSAKATIAIFLELGLAGSVATFSILCVCIGSDDGRELVHGLLVYCNA